MSRKFVTGADLYGTLMVDPTPINGSLALRVKMDATIAGIDPTKDALQVYGDGLMMRGYGADPSPGEFFSYGNTYVENGWMEVGRAVAGFTGTRYFEVFPGCPAIFDDTVTLHADPTLPLQAATKQYVDNISTAGGAFVPLAGGTMTGPLRINMTTDLSLISTDHPFQIGPTTGANMRFDNNEIQGVNNGVAADFWINFEGGKVRLGTGGIQSYGAFEATTSGGRLMRYRYTGIEYYEVDGTTWATVPINLQPNVCLPNVAAAANAVTLASQNNVLTLGALAGDSMAFSKDSIGVRSAGSATRLKLQPAGGDVELGSDTVNSGLLLRGPGPSNNGIWMYTGNPGAFTGQVYCDWASVPTMIFESPRSEGGVASIRAYSTVELKATNGTELLTLTAGAGLTVTAYSKFLRSTGACIGLYRTPSPVNEDPYLGFYLSDGTTRLGYLQGNGSATTYPGIMLTAEQSGPIRLRTAGSDTLIINSATSAELARFNTGATGYVAFYEGTTRRGYMGHYAAGNMRLWADTGACTVGCQTAGQVVTFATGNIERGRFDDNGHFCVGQTNATVTTSGIYLHAAQGTVGTAMDLLNQPNFIANQIGAANAAGSDVMHFRMANTTRGTITHPTTTTTAYNTSSDYRLKDVLGPVTDAVERLMLLKPRHVRWKENGEEMDTFIAHEVDEVVDWAVTGKKDAVDEEGAIIPQQLDASKLIPLLTAAVQELAHRVADLETV